MCNSPNGFARPPPLAKWAYLFVICLLRRYNCFASFLIFPHFTSKMNPNLNQLAINGSVVFFIYEMRFCTEHNHLFAAPHHRAYVHTVHTYVYATDGSTLCWNRSALIYTVLYYIRLLLNIRWYWNLIVFLGCWVSWFSIFILFGVKFMDQNTWWFNVCGYG